MSSFGVTPEGFVQKTVEDILAELSDDEIEAFGAAFNTTPASLAGQMNAIFGDKVAELWEVAAAVYAALYPDSSQDAALDGVSAFTGVTRLAATKSTVTLRANLDAGTILNVGRVVSVSVTGERFITREQVQNGTGVQANIAVEAESEEFGPILGSAGTIDTIESPVSGWTAEAAIDSSLTEPFALSNGQTLFIETDGGAVQTVTFITGDFVAIGAALAAEVAAAIDANTTGISSFDANGAVRCVSDTDGPGSSIQITGGTANPQLGFATDLVAGMNDSDALIGRNIESDQDMRIRREELLRISGAGTLEALRSAVREVLNVLQAFVFENVTLVTDPNGLPAKSFEVVASGGLDQTAAQAIFDTKPVGQESFRDPGGNGVTVVIEDSQGVDHDINFSRPTEVPMFIDVDVSVEGTVFGGGDQNAGVQQVKDALSVLGQQQQIGGDVYILRYQCAALDVAGVLDVGLTEVEDIFPPTNVANIIMDVRELATFDTSDMRVFVTVI